nr:PH domain-containing protein [Ornithinimicrobium sp. F0845]
MSALAVVAALGATAVLQPGGWALADRALVWLLALLLGAALWRFGMVRAVPGASGLKVVNLIHSRELEWAQILRVSFGGGSPWVVLELSDTEELAVMGIQRADGAFGRAEAARLAALVEHHSR